MASYSSGHSREADVINAFREASKSLGFDVTAPFAFQQADSTVKCLAFLPHFGSRQGIVVGATSSPDFGVDRELIHCAREVGVTCSFINVARYARYDEEQFKEMLLDWGYFGPADKRPTWMDASGQKTRMF